MTPQQRGLEVHKMALVDQLTQQRGLEVHKMALVDQLTVINSQSKVAEPGE